MPAIKGDMYINTHCNYSQPTLIKLYNENIGGHLTPLQCSYPYIASRSTLSSPHHHAVFIKDQDCPHWHPRCPVICPLVKCPPGHVPPAQTLIRSPATLGQKPPWSVPPTDVSLIGSGVRVMLLIHAIYLAVRTPFNNINAKPCTQLPGPV